MNELWQYARIKTPHEHGMLVGQIGFCASMQAGCEILQRQWTDDPCDGRSAQSPIACALRQAASSFVIVQGYEPRSGQQGVWSLILQHRYGASLSDDAEDVGMLSDVTQSSHVHP